MSDSPAPDTTPARLLVTRQSERDCRSRQIFVSLDGTSVGDIVFGEKIDKPMNPGHHVVRIHNTLFWKTLEFDAAPGETVQIGRAHV
mgnify:CR=1 FL=1